MNDELLARVAADLVLAGWDQQIESAEPLGGGMNSATALVGLGGERAVLKWVPQGSVGALASGCEVALLLARHGLLTGDPIPTRADELTFLSHRGAVALFRFVDGEALDPTNPRDRHDMGVTLADIHAVDATHESGLFICDVVAGQVHDVEPWVRPAVAVVLDEYRSLPALTWGLLHGDPTADAFLRQADTEKVGVIDWGSAGRGPVLYDVASALMYLGGRDRSDAFWVGYLAHSPAPARELDSHLGAFMRFRAAVQAAYFSMRIARKDRTGISDDTGNRKGLRDAEQMLRANGVELTTAES
jgi:Ser/Thr protein kinase RdoA (MazF antagonist)